MTCELKDDAVWFLSRFFYWLGDTCYRLAYKIEWCRTTAYSQARPE